MRKEFEMGRLRMVRVVENEFTGQTEKPDPLERFKGVTRDLTEKALKIVQKLSANEMSKPEPEAELVEDYYLLHHYLDFLRRFASSGGSNHSIVRSE